MKHFKTQEEKKYTKELKNLTVSYKYNFNGKGGSGKEGEGRSHEESGGREERPALQGLSNGVHGGPEELPKESL